MNTIHQGLITSFVHVYFLSNDLCLRSKCLHSKIVKVQSVDKKNIYL